MNNKKNIKPNYAKKNEIIFEEDNVKYDKKAEFEKILKIVEAYKKIDRSYGFAY